MTQANQLTGLVYRKNQQTRALLSEESGMTMVIYNHSKAKPQLFIHHGDAEELIERRKEALVIQGFAFDGVYSLTNDYSLIKPCEESNDPVETVHWNIELITPLAFIQNINQRITDFQTKGLNITINEIRPKHHVLDIDGYIIEFSESAAQNTICLSTGVGRGIASIMDFQAICFLLHVGKPFGVTISDSSGNVISPRIGNSLLSHPLTSTQIELVRNLGLAQPFLEIKPSRFAF